MDEKKVSIDPENAEKILGWIKSRGGLAVWNSVNLSNPGGRWFSPVLSEDGKPYGKPNWQCANVPVIVTDLAQVEVKKGREVKRFKIHTRISDQGMMIKLTDHSSEKVWDWLDKVKEQYGDSWYQFDYDNQEAVIFAPDGSCLLSEFK